MVADSAEWSKLSVYRTEARQALPSFGGWRAGAEAGAGCQPAHAWCQTRANSFSRWGHAAVSGQAVTGADRECGGGRVNKTLTDRARLVKPAEAAELLALSRRTLRRYEVSGRLPAVKINQRVTRYRLSDIIRTMEVPVGPEGN